MVPLGNRECSNVIQVGMRNHDCVGGIVWEFLVTGEGIGSFLLWMHTGIQKNEAAIQIQGVGIAPDFSTEIQ